MQCICSGHMRRIWGRSHRRVVTSKIPCWGLQVKRIVRSNVIVDMFPCPHGLVELGELQIPHVAIVELFGVRSLGPLDVPVEFG